MKYEIIRNDLDRLVGTCWWDGKSIKTSNKETMALLKTITVNNKSFEDGPEFLKFLPFYAKNGYVSIKKIKDD